MSDKHSRYVRQPSSCTTSSPSAEQVEVDGDLEITPDSSVIKLYTQRFPIPDPTAVVYILHGFGEHSDRYEGFSRILNGHGFSVATHDHIGHGMSDGERVFIDNFETYITDSLALMREQKLPGKPFIIFGHSMGGLIALHCMLREPDLFSGGILSSPCLKIHGKYDNSPMRTIAKLMNAVAPRFYIPSKSLALDPADVVGNASDRNSYVSDPLVWHYGTRAGSAVAMLGAMKEAEEKLQDLSVRCFIQHGTHDLVCDPAGVYPFRDIPETATLKLYERAKHALLMDEAPIKELVIADCIEFMKSVK